MNAKRKKADPYVEKILATLRDQYGVRHPKAQIEVYRYNSASIRIRIIDPGFAGINWIDREEIINPILDALPEDIQAEITVLLLITPKERKSSFMSMEFDDRTRSLL